MRKKALINVQADVTRKAIGLNFCLGIDLHTYFVYTSSEGSNESAYMPGFTHA